MAYDLRKCLEANYLRMWYGFMAALLTAILSCNIPIRHYPRLDTLLTFLKVNGNLLVSCVNMSLKQSHDHKTGSGWAASNGLACCEPGIGQAVWGLRGTMQQTEWNQENTTAKTDQSHQATTWWLQRERERAGERERRRRQNHLLYETI